MLASNKEKISGNRGIRAGVGKGTTVAMNMAQLSDSWDKAEGGEKGTQRSVGRAFLAEEPETVRSWGLRGKAQRKGWLVEGEGLGGRESSWPMWAFGNESSGHITTSVASLGVLSVAMVQTLRTWRGECR